MVCEAQTALLKYKGAFVAYLSGEMSTTLKCEPRYSRHCRLVVKPVVDS
jgi:hypothetical protein